MAISEYDYVKVGSGTEETYVPFDDSGGGYNVSAALDNINGEVITGGLENKTDYLEETKGQIKQAIIDKGGTVETNATFRSYAEKIEELSPAICIERTVDENNGLIVGGTNVIDLTGITNLGSYSMAYGYTENMGISGVALRNATSLTTVDGEKAASNAFRGCENITSTGASYIQTVSGIRAFEDAFLRTAITTTGFDNLISIIGDNAFYQAFYACRSLATVGMDNLETIQGFNAFSYAFQVCPLLKVISFPKVKNITGRNAFSNAFDTVETIRFDSLDNFGTDGGFGQRSFNVPPLKDVYLGGIKSTTFSQRTDVFDRIFGTNTGATASEGCTLHLPTNFDPENPNKTFDITTLQGYPTFGGLEDYIHLAFDLPATE